MHTFCNLSSLFGKILQLVLVLVSTFAFCNARTSPHLGSCTPFLLPAAPGGAPALTVHTNPAASTLHAHTRAITSPGGAGQPVCSPAGLRDVEVWARGSTADPLKDLRPLSKDQVHRAVTSTGRGGPFDAFIRKLTSGAAVHVAVLGGSITVGEGSEPDWEAAGVAPDPRVRAAGQHPYSWGELLFGWLNASFAHPGHRFTNGAVSASRSAYMEVCLSSHLDVDDVDLVFVEYALNDGQGTPTQPRSMERLIRKVLQLPRAPAVVLVNMWSFKCDVEAVEGMPAPAGGRAEHCRRRSQIMDEAYGALARYYNAPAVSFHGATWREAVLLNRSGYLIPADGATESEWKRERYFMRPDREHPNHRGHRMLAQLGVHLVHRAVTDAVLYPHPHHGDPALPSHHLPASVIPPPYLLGNFESKTKGCYHGAQLQGLVVKNEGWTVVDEGPRFNGTKYGFASKEVGDIIQLRLNTRLGGDNGGDTGDGIARLSLGILRSYESMGMARMVCVECVCKCISYQCLGVTSGGERKESIMIDGIWRERSTQTDIYNFEVSQSAACTIDIKNVKPLDGRAHRRIKIMSLMLAQDEFVDVAIGHSETSDA